jgi:outer membrane immunogenic protein
MKTILLAASAALLASTAPALAQDATAPSPSLFTGPRAEIFGGWDRLRRTDHVDNGHSTTNGVTGGALLGYDLPIGNRFIAGPFASYAISSSKECVSGVGCVKSGNQIEGGARFGMKFANKALVYAKGAYVRGDFNAHVVNGVGSGAPEYDIANDHRGGWRAGAGLQYALTRHAYVKAEYDYTKFKTIAAEDFGGINDSAIRFDRQEVLGGFGIQF